MNARLAVIVDGPPTSFAVYLNLIELHSPAFNVLVLLNRMVAPIRLKTSHPLLGIGSIEVPTNKLGNETKGRSLLIGAFVVVL